MAAPHWLVQLVRLGPAPVQWQLVVRAALAIAGPIAVGLAFGELATGVQASVGALCGTFVARAGPYRFRLRRIGFACVAGTFGFLAGGVSAGYGWVSSVVLVVLAVVSALVSAVGANASVAALMMLVFGVLGTGQGDMWDPYVAAVWFAVGAGWTLLLAIGAWPMRATLPERAALAAVYGSLADLLTAAGSRASGPARQKLTAAMNDAYDALLSARSRLEGRDADYRRLFVVLAETTPVVEAGVALHNARRRPSQALIEAVIAMGEAIRTDAAPPPLQQLGGTSLAVALRGVASVMRGGKPQEKAERRTPTARERFDARLDALRPGPATWQFAARLALCVGLAELLARQLELERSYWVTLTVALVLKPDFGSVFARAVQRAGGTVLGVLLGAAVLVSDPRGWLLVALVVVLAGLLPVGQTRNYGLFSIFVTPLVIVQLDLAMAGDWALVPARLIDTVTGCAIVLVFGYLLWPGSRTPRLGGQLAAVADTLARYTDRALSEDPTGRSALRRRAYRQLSDLRVEAQRLISEPSLAGRTATAWWPAIVGLERVTDAVTRVAVELDDGARVRPEDADAMVLAIEEVAAAVRGERPPQKRPLPEDPQLVAVAVDLNALYDALRAPDLSRPRRRRRRRRGGARQRRSPR